MQKLAVSKYTEALPKKFPTYLFIEEGGGVGDIL